MTPIVFGMSEQRTPFSLPAELQVVAREVDVLLKTNQPSLARARLGDLIRLIDAHAEKRFVPTRPGHYRFQSPDGRERLLKVVGQNGELYAVTGWLGLFATPVDEMEGRWIG